MSAEVRIGVDVPLDETELDALFCASWPGYVRRNFAPVLARSLVFSTAHLGERLVGFVNVATDGGEHAFLLDPTVHPDVRRRGIGLALVRRALVEAERRGARWVHVDFVPELEPFYRAAGFRSTTAGLFDVRADR